MSRAAAVLLAATVGLGACHATLNFGATDAGGGGCTSDQDCPLPSLHCDSFTRQCQACASDGDCASTSGRPHCDSVLRLCVQCAGDQDCGTSAKCIPITRTCVKTCATAADCTVSGSWCDDSICSQCDGDHDCSGTRPHCDPTTNQCVGCAADAQCTSAATPRCNRAVGQCVGCVTSADCAGATVCDPADWTCK